MILKKCLKCGNEFQSNKNGTKKFCSDTCKVLFNRKREEHSSVNELPHIETPYEETKRLYNESIQYFETHTLEQARAEGRWIPNRYRGK